MTESKGMKGLIDNKNDQGIGRLYAKQGTPAATWLITSRDPGFTRYEAGRTCSNLASANGHTGLAW